MGSSEPSARVLEVCRGTTVMEFACRDGMTIEVKLKEIKEAS
jgi:hypothetical protein